MKLRHTIRKDIERLWPNGAIRKASISDNDWEWLKFFKKKE